MLPESTGAVTQQGQIEGWPPRCIGGQRARWRRHHLPAGVRHARLRISANPEQDRRDARPFGSERQTPCCGKIKRFRSAPGFKNNRTEGCAPHGIQTCRQRVRHTLRTHDDQVARIKPQWNNPVWIKCAGFGFDRPLPDPDCRSILLRFKPLQNPKRDPCQGRRAGRSLRNRLVERAAFQTAVQNMIYLLNAKRDMLFRSLTMARKTLFQSRHTVAESADAFSHSTPMFIICSFYQKP